MFRNTAKVFFLFTFVCAFLWVLPADAAGWVTQSSGVTGHLKDIKMLSHKVGFAVGESAILKTTNGGQTWSNVCGGCGSFDGIAMSSESVGWVVGASGKILKTSNGGADWQEQISGVTANLKDVAFFSSTEVIAVGKEGTILRTMDGGTTWTKLSAGTSAILYGVSWGFDTGSPVLKKVWISGSSGLVVFGQYTGSNAPTWTLQNSGASDILYDIARGPALSQEVWVAGGKGQVLMTLDGGGIWTAKNNPALTQDLYAVTQVDSVIYATGQDGIIYTGVNSGGSYTWTSGNSGANLPLYALAVRVSPLTIWAVGNSGKIVRYDETAPTAPSNLTKTTADNDNTPTFTWTASSDDVDGTYGTGISKYEYSLDGAGYLSNGSNTSLTLSQALTDGQHTLAVRAVDAADNVSTAASLSFSISAADTIAPSVGALTPNTALAGVAQTFSVTYSDAVGVTSCKFFSGDTEKGVMTLSGGAINGTASLSFTFPSAVNYAGYNVKCYDAAGNSGHSGYITVSVYPTGTVSINGAAASTNNPAVTLTLACKDNGIDCYQMKIAVDGTVDNKPWETFTVTKAVTLPSGDGLKTVAVKFYGKAGGNVSEQITDTIMLSTAVADTTAPAVGAVSPATAVAGTAQNFSAAYSDAVGVASCDFYVNSANRGAMSLGAAQSGTAQKTHTFTTAGSYEVYASCKDAAQNPGMGSPKTTVVVTSGAQADTSAPTGSITINNGAATTNSTSATVNLTCSDNVSCYQMLVSVDSVFDTEIWESYAASKTVSLLGGDGVKDVSVKFKDHTGNTSITYSASITFSAGDTTSPTVGSITPTTAQATVAQSFTASYSDAVGVVSCDLYVDSSNQGPMSLSGTTAGTASRTYTFSDAVSHSLQARCSDAADNVGLGALTTVSVSAAPVVAADTVAPSVPSGVKKVSDDTDKTPTFTWNSATDNTGVTSYVIQVDNGSLIDVGGALTYTAGSLFDGSHTIKVFAKDAAGNSSNVASFSFTVSASAPVPAPVSCSLTINGAYKLTGSPAVYYITDECNKRPFSKSNVFFTYFDSWSDVKVITKTKLDKISLDTLGFMPWGPKYDPKYGALVKIVTDPKVYLLLGGEKYWITAEEIFTGLKYSWNWVEDIDKKLLDKYVTGSEINYTDHHPNYTLIKYAASPKIYRLEPDPADLDKQVKRYIKNEAVFNALNFRWDRIVTISKSETYKDGEELDEGDV